MKRGIVVFAVMLLGVVVHAQQAPNPEMQAALAKQQALEKATPQLQITEEILPLMMPGHTMGETEGVAKDSKGQLYVYSRTGKAGIARGGTAAELFQFDQNLKFVKEWGPDSYGSTFAHAVRVDKYDNVWIVDEGSNMVIKYNPQGVVTLVLGRKPEAIDWIESYIQRGERDKEQYTEGRMGTFNRPTDVTFDTQDNIFVSDGYNNNRVAKISKDGVWLKSVGTRGSAPNQFNLPHAITSDAKGNIYVADRGNRRVQVFDPDLNPVRIISGMGAPWGVCVTPGPTQYLFSGDGTGKLYKFDLNGNLVGWAQTKEGQGQTSCLIHSVHCESENVVYVGSCSTWNVEKITVKGTKPAGK